MLISIDPRLHKVLKAAAALRGQSLRDLSNELIKQGLDLTEDEIKDLLEQAKKLERSK